MGQTTEILLSVLCFVALLAERLSIANFKTKIRVLRERLDVVCFKIAASVIVAPPACEFISEKYIVTPAFIFCRKAKTAALRYFPVFVARALRPSNCDRSYRCADCRAVIDSTSNPTFLANKSWFAAHILTGIFAEFPALHWRRPIYPGWLFAFPAFATPSGDSIPAAPVTTERFLREPSLAFRAMFLAFTPSSPKLFDRYSEPMSRYYFRANDGLRHTLNSTINARGFNG